MSYPRKQATSEKIIDAAIELFAQNGYDRVTTEEIAQQAGFSEKTLFRHFKSKQNLLERAIDRYHYIDEMRSLFDHKLTGDVQKDLQLIGENYQRIMYRNRKLLRILMKVGRSLPGLHQYARQHPEQLQKYLTSYFKEMKKQKKIRAVDEEKVAITFLYMNFGLAQGRINEEPVFSEIEFNGILKESIELFTRGILP